MSVRFAILASGSGTNLQALLDEADRPDFPGEVAVVLSNKPNAYALERARTAGIPVEVVTRRAFPERSDWDREAAERLRAHRVDWICLAGFMRIVSPAMLEAFPNRIVNIHPSLLPSFPGLHAHRQALEAGVCASGCTVHMVDRGVDTGTIIAQGVVPVLQRDTEETLQRRILGVEHRVYPAVMRWIAQGLLTCDPDGTLRVDLPSEEKRFFLAEGLSD